MQVRSATRYATLRTVVDVSAVISILALAIMLLIILVGGALGRGSDAEVGAVVMLVFGAVMIALVIAARQASILFVDIADILIWHGSRSSKDRG